MLLPDEGENCSTGACALQWRAKEQGSRPLWSYACATQCPVLTKAMSYRTTRFLRDAWYCHGPSTSVLRACYAVSGTEIRGV
eukprot:579665-Rhodomonas_salina.2